MIFLSLLQGSQRTLYTFFFWSGVLSELFPDTQVCTKSAVLLKGQWPEALKLQLLSTGLKFQDTYKYLGIEFGNVTSEQAFSHALQKALGRAFAMQSWALSLPERVMLLKLWILPLLVYPARVVFPSPAVVNTLRTVYQVALKLNSWAVTLNILSHPPQSGRVQPGTARDFSPLAARLCFCGVRERPFECTQGPA